MSHIVIHDGVDGITRYRRFDSLEASIEYLEELHNTDGTDGAQLFSLDEVEFAVKSYIKVEIGGTAEPEMGNEPEMISEPEMVHEPQMVDEPAPAMPEILPTVDTVEFVEAAMATPTESDEESITTNGPGDSRRGLFGR